MNDQHGYAAGYDGYSTGAFDTTSFDADPLFGALPGTDQSTGAEQSYGTEQSYDTGQTGQWQSGTWDSSQWPTGTQDPYATDPYGTGTHDALHTGAHSGLSYDPYAAQHNSGYETGSYDTTAMWATGGYQQLADIPSQPGPDATEQWDATGQWQTQGFEQTGSFENTGAFEHNGSFDQAGSFEQPGSLDQTGAFEHNGSFGETGGFEHTGAFEQPAGLEHGQAFDTGAYDATAWNSGAPDGAADALNSTSLLDPVDPDVPFTAEQGGAEPQFSPAEFASDLGPGDGHPDGAPFDLDPAHAGPHAQDGPRGRSRRRAPAKRSALLTVAVPSVCALGVAGIAAASVAGGLSSDQGETKTQAAPDPTAVKPSTANNKLDTQLANLSADAGDFADRASRTQERIDLKERQEAERKRKEAEAARKEAMRPKFALPVAQHGLSALYGQGGINWMSVHSGIDFPVSYGTPVMAATDGTVRTQWNSAYGNMAIVTSPDGTETWYCHLSSTKIRSGSVKAGDTIAYSGNSGNSTGPHLHFEVRPGGGSAIDPLPWLRSHGLDPQ